MRKLLLVCCLVVLFFVKESIAQEENNLSTIVFVRHVNVVNAEFDVFKPSYSPVLSGGIGFYGKRIGTDIAFFINKADVIGFYSFNTLTLNVKELEDWKLVTNIFGEYVYIPAGLNDIIDNDVHTFTVGLNTAFVKEMPWGSVALPFVIGPSCTADGNWGMTVRFIANLAIKF